MLLEYYKYLLRQGPAAFSRGVPYARCAEYPAVVRALDLRPEDRLLDIGTRFSPIAQILALRYGCRVWAADPEPGFAAAQLKMADRVPATRRLVAEGRLNFLEKDAADLPFDDGFFNKISVISVLEHIPDESHAVGELARVLDQAGRLVISVPYDPWRDEPRYYRSQVYIKGDMPKKQFYMRYYNDKNLHDRIVRYCKHELVKTEYIGEPGFNAHNLIFENQKIPWVLRRIFFQPFAPLLASVFIKNLEPEQFRKKKKMYTADTAILVFGAGVDCV
ncbi:MAG: methyltransferase domain-containing protein [Candidatus Eisenbacteria bacterium]|nr:methyltransferase domain-containing protein [Candidatus Eisenbacteria bacterium]